MQRGMSILLAFCLFAGQTACSSLGPKATVTPVARELAASKAFDKIFVAPTLGTRVADAERDVNRAVPASAYGLYEDRIVLVDGLAAPFKGAGVPERAAAVAALG